MVGVSGGGEDTVLSETGEIILPKEKKSAHADKKRRLSANEHFLLSDDLLFDDYGLFTMENAVLKQAKTDGKF